jgi:threonine dehydratase
MQHIIDRETDSFIEHFYQHVIQTPLLHYGRLPTPWGELYLKDETKQTTGAFKFRGDFRRLLCLHSTGQVVTTASTGNHGLGLSTAARLLGIQAHVFVPATTAHVKLQSIVMAGAIISKVDGDYEHCKQASKAFAEETGSIYISGFDDPEIIAGHMSLFSEVENQQSQGFDVVFVPIGGGGLLAACLQYYQERNVKVIGVELDSAPAMSLSLAQGQLVMLEKAVGRTEGLLIRQVGAIPFQIAQQAKNFEILLVSDEQINYAIRLLWQYNGIRAEGAGAAALAAALCYSQAKRDQKALAIVSGGNIDEENFQDILTDTNPDILAQ